MVDKTPIRVAAIHVNKINAIRAIRELSDVNLKDAKNIIDRICSDESIIEVVAVSSCRFGQHTLTLDLDQVKKGV